MLKIIANMLGWFMAFVGVGVGIGMVVAGQPWFIYIWPFLCGLWAGLYALEVRHD